MLKEQNKGHLSGFSQMQMQRLLHK